MKCRKLKIKRKLNGPNKLKTFLKIRFQTSVINPENIIEIRNDNYYGYIVNFIEQQLPMQT